MALEGEETYSARFILNMHRNADYLPQGLLNFQLLFQTRWKVMPGANPPTTVLVPL